MRKQIPLDNPDQFPDLLSCFQGRTNGRQRAEYRRFLYRSIKTQLTQRQRQMMELRYFQGFPSRRLPRSCASTNPPSPAPSTGR